MNIQRDNSAHLVKQALSFQTPDRLPVYDGFWEDFIRSTNDDIYWYLEGGIEASSWDTAFIHDEEEMEMTEWHLDNLEKYKDWIRSISDETKINTKKFIKMFNGLYGTMNLI